MALKIIDRILIALVAGALIYAAFMYSTNLSFGSAPSGLTANAATTSTIYVGPQERLIWFDGTTDHVATNCAARIVSTGANGILLSFDGTSSSTATSSLAATGTTGKGHWQAASTTVVYDGGQVGCRRIGLLGVNSSSTVTITETR